MPKVGPSTLAAGHGLHPNQPLCRIGLTMSAASLAQLLALYVAIGLCTAAAFVTIGIQQVLAQPARAVDLGRFVVFTRNRDEAGRAATENGVATAATTPGATLTRNSQGQE